MPNRLILSVTLELCIGALLIGALVIGGLLIGALLIEPINIGPINRSSFQGLEIAALKAQDFGRAGKLHLFDGKK